MVKTVQRITAWSYSRLNDYLACPFLAYLKCIKKLREPSSPAMEEGTRIHTLAEDYLRGYKKRRPSELDKLADLFKHLYKHRKILQLELELAFDRNWDATSWFSRDAWVRIKADVMYDDPKDDSLRHIIDWKTGRYWPSHEEQLELYAIGAFLTAPPNITRVDAHLGYTKDGEIVSKTFMRADAKKLQKKWEKKAAPMLRDATFKPTPTSNQCRRCYFRKSNGGPCKF